MASITAYVVGETVRPLTLSIQALTDEEKEIIRCGSLIKRAMISTIVMPSS